MVVERGDGDDGPKERPILADAQAFFLEKAYRSCNFEIPLRIATVDVLGRVESREMLADNLFGFVAFDPLGPGIPTGDVAGSVEHENGMAPHAFQDDAALFLGSTQLFVALRQLRGAFQDQRFQPVVDLA